MLTDNDRARIEYSTMLEQKISHLQTEIAKFEPIAKFWKPEITSVQLPNSDVQLSVTMAGKSLSVVLSAEVLTSSDANAALHIASSDVANILLESIIRKELQPVVEQCRVNALLMKRAGTW